MDVFNVGSRQAAQAPEGRSLERRAPANGTHAARQKAGRVTDSFATSSRAHRVERQVSRLANGEVDAVREELVTKFKALMDIGALDTAAAARRAAEGLLDSRG